MSASSRLLQITQQYKQQLLRQEQQAIQHLEAAHSRTLATIKPKLDQLYDAIAEKLAAGEDIPLSWIYERLRMESLSVLIKHQIDQFAAIALQQTRMEQHGAMQLGLKSAQDQLEATKPGGITWTFGVPSTEAIAQLVGATQAGSPLADLFNGFGAEAASAAAQALITGVSLGHNPRLIAARVQQALSIARSRAMVIARTEALRAYRGAALATYRANDDVCEGWVWSASLSARTCAACIAMNGTKHKLDEEFGSHPNCRCAPVPLTKSWDDILGQYGIDTSGIEDTSVDIQSGSDWFDEQDESVQRQILGKAGYDLYASGDVTLEDFIKKTHDADWGASIQVRPLKELVNR